MRRKDREVSDIDEILSIIDRCEVLSLGLSENDAPYVVPLNFGYEYTDGKLSLYFHGALEGKKHDIIKKNRRAAFAMSCSNRLVLRDDGASATMKYESVMGVGEIESLTGIQEKRHGLMVLMRQYSKDREYEFPDEVINKTSVLRLNVENFTGKRNI